MSRLRLSWRDFATAFAVFIIASGLNLWLARWIGYQAVVVVYLLAVVLLALVVGA